MRTFAIKEDTPLDYLAGIVTRELLHIQSNAFCVSFKNRPHIKRFMPVFLMFIDHVMHFPKLALQPGRFRGARGRERVHVIRHQRKLAKDYAQLRWTVIGFYSFQNWMKRTTGWTLEVAKLLQGSRRFRVSERVCWFGAGFCGIYGSRGRYWRRARSRRRLRIL